RPPARSRVFHHPWRGRALSSLAAADHGLRLARYEKSGRLPYLWGHMRELIESRFEPLPRSECHCLLYPCLGAWIYLFMPPLLLLPLYIAVFSITVLVSAC